MSSLTYYALFALVVSYFVMRFVSWLKRRAKLREFAARNGLRYRGTLPSDKYEPYKWFAYVSRAVLLYNVMEGS